MVCLICSCSWRALWDKAVRLEALNLLVVIDMFSSSSSDSRASRYYYLCVWCISDYWIVNRILKLSGWERLKLEDWIYWKLCVTIVYTWCSCYDGNGQRFWNEDDREFIKLRLDRCVKLIDPVCHQNRVPHFEDAFGFIQYWRYMYVIVCCKTIKWQLISD